MLSLFFLEKCGFQYLFHLPVFDRVQRIIALLPEIKGERMIEKPMFDDKWQLTMQSSPESGGRQDCVRWESRHPF